MTVPPREDHRAHVGGAWDEVGIWQFHLLKDLGLQPEDFLLDVGCGSLRGGRYFIDYLDPGRYYGTELYGPILGQGLLREIPWETVAAKSPMFLLGDGLQIQRFQRPFSWVLCQSIFTHLDGSDAILLLQNLAQVLTSTGSRAVTTWFRTDHPGNARVLDESRHDAVSVFETSWIEARSGEWGLNVRWLEGADHPRGQFVAILEPMTWTM